MNENNPFSYSLSNKRYHTWDYHLKEKFGGKVFKVSLDGGFSCPNIDGTKGRGGCTYCAYSFKRQSAGDLARQFRQGVEALHRKWPEARQYIPCLLYTSLPGRKAGGYHRPVRGSDSSEFGSLFAERRGEDSRHFSRGH